MIWALGLGLAIVVSLYLAAPFLVREVAQSDTTEIDAYKAELRALAQSEEPEAAKKSIIQARLLKAAKADLPISAEDIATLQKLSEEDRQAAIENMVESLSTRLEDNPNNVQGWLRLLRARKVLDQSDAAASDIVRLRAAVQVFLRAF